MKKTLSEQQEICIDCQDKVFKFYRFKHKVKAFQTQNIKSNCTNKATIKRPRFKSRIIHRISDIIENYTKSCSIASIRIEKDNRRLVIEADHEDSDDDVIVKQEPFEDLAEKYWENTTADVSEFLGISITEEASDVSISSNQEVLGNIDVKEEPSDLPVIVSCSTLEVPDVTSRRGRRRNGQFGDEGKNVSQAALKMRAYRQRLKTPGNELRMLRMMQKQREWNRNYYIRKQMSSGQPIRSRRRRTDLMSDIEIVEDICNRRSF